MNVVVLAGSIREANAYAIDKGIRVRYANIPDDLKLATKIIELPGFAERRDRFTLQEALKNRQRFGTPAEYELEADWVRPAPVVEPEHDPAADRRDRLVDAANEAVEALAADMGVLPQELIDQLASKPTPSPRKRAAKKAAAPAPVVNPPVEF